MSPRTPEQIASLKESRREQILEAAFQLFSTKGYHQTAISDIAKKAELSKGLLYNYFESKEDLLNQVLIYSFKDVITAGEEMTQVIDTIPIDVLFRNLIHSFFSMMKEQEEIMKLTLSLAAQVSAIPTVHNTIVGVYDELTKQLEYVFEKMNYKEPKKEAMLLGAIIDGVGIQYLLDVNNYPIEEMEQMILNKYIDNE